MENHGKSWNISQLPLNIIGNHGQILLFGEIVGQGEALRFDGDSATARLPFCSCFAHAVYSPSHF